MSEEETTTTSSATTTTTTSSATTTTTSNSQEKIKSATQSLSAIIPSISTTNPNSLLNDPNIHSKISTLLREPNSGSGDNNLCRWLYDTFQSTVPDLQLLVLHFIPILTGVYLSRVPLRKPQAGFEAVLLALYAHETTARSGQAVTVTIPDLFHPSLYHEAKAPPSKNNATDLNIAVVSPSLEPHGTVRSTRRARIVGVALELFYSKISQMPIKPKIDFCEFCKIWAGQDGEMYEDFEEDKGELGEQERNEDGEKVLEVGEGMRNNDENSKKKKEGRIPLPWELMQPMLRILAHCVMGPHNKDLGLFAAASEASRCLYARALHDVNPMAILATRSVLRLSKNNVMGNGNEDDPTEIHVTEVLTL